ncbi:hypothetical protein [Methylosinus sp. R-45379]|uniref:hypothetical protein n=1 Tax=Methylosinus sp. R-45379 TaxID=980563 RepID=UPI0012ED80AF|nr:hypothetical protein [Methylosinus sp. R-45379]
MARIEEALAQIAESQKRFSDETEDLLRLIDEYHVELIRETGERLRRKIERAEE